MDNKSGTFVYSSCIIDKKSTYRMKNNYIRTRGSFLLKIYEQSISVSAEEQRLNFSIKEQNSSNCRTIRKVHFSLCLFTYNCKLPSCASTNKNFI